MRNTNFSVKCNFRNAAVALLLKLFRSWKNKPFELAASKMLYRHLTHNNQTQFKML